MRGAGIAAALGAVGLLSACAGNGFGGNAVDAAGCVSAYRAQQSTAGDLQGADLNRAYKACLARVGATPEQVRIAESGQGYTPRVKGAEAMTGGAGYYGAHPQTGKPLPPLKLEPGAPAKAPKAVAGKLPLPTNYPLMPGDAALWASLTLQQQQRALVFLKNGGTIRSSLEPNR